MADFLSLAQAILPAHFSKRVSPSPLILELLSWLGRKRDIKGRSRDWRITLVQQTRSRIHDRDSATSVFHSPSNPRLIL